MSAAPSAGPDRYAVLGNPVAHSRSPFIHAEFARQTGHDIRYGRVLCPMDGFEAAVRAFAASQEEHAGPALGCNVTIPFKFEAPRLAAHVSARATLAQAANVLRFGPDDWHADNTDGIGLVRDLQHNADFDLAAARVLLIGAGGAAAGVLGPLIEAGAGEIVVANRTPERASALVERHRAVSSRVRLSTAALDDCGTCFDLVINASASSVNGNAAPVAPIVLRDGGLAVDLMYGAPAEGFIAWAQAHGAQARDGLGMLVEQAAEAFYFWRGVRPHTAAVLQALRQHMARGDA
jgi:shikimate dehydrogenase